MAPIMLAYNEVTPKRLIIVNDQPYEVLTSWVFRKQQRKPVNQTKLRNLKTGASIDYTFHQPDKIEEAEVETRQMKFIYERNGEWWFHEAESPAKRISVPEHVVGDAGKFLAANTIVDTLWFNEELLQIRLPIKMDLKVKEAPPNVKGNTAQGGVKPVVLETGASVNVPMFINEGDVVRVNTETGQYVERV